MKAVVLDRFGGADAVRVTEVPSPLAGDGEVLVEMHAASVNPADWKLREGWLQAAFEPAFPYVLGFDGAGVVAGTDQRVVVKTAVGRGGSVAMAELTAVLAHLAVSLPDAIPFETAAALPTAGITAWEAVVEQGGVRPGQRVLINGGAGGTGSIAIQIARMIGAEVAATARPANHAYLRSLGATPIDYRAPVLEAAVAAVFPGGVDVLIDTVGQGVLASPLSMIVDGGRLVTVATLIPDEPRPHPEEAAARGISILTASSNREREAAQLAALVTAVADGHIRLPEIEIVPMDQAPEAIERVRQGHVRGKLVLTIR